MDVAALDAGLAERLSWQARRVELPAGRYETLLPPTAVADMLIYLYWSAGRRDAGEGRTVFSRPGGGTRIGERLAAAAASTCSATRRTRGWSARRSWWRTRPAGTRRCSTTGCRAGLASWISAGVLSALHSSRYSASPAGAPGHARRWTT